MKKERMTEPNGLGEDGGHTARRDDQTCASRPAPAMQQNLPEPLHPAAELQITQRPGECAKETIAGRTRQVPAAGARWAHGPVGLLVCFFNKQTAKRKRKKKKKWEEDRSVHRGSRDTSATLRKPCLHDSHTHCGKPLTHVER